MIRKKRKTRELLILPVAAAILAAMMISGCAVATGHRDGQAAGRAAESRGIAAREGAHSGGEHGSGRANNESSERGNGGTASDGGGETGEAAMSSPIVPLEQSWRGVLGGLAVSARYEAATRTVRATVRNSLAQRLCYVQAEPHLKSGTKTVGELGPEKLGHLSPGQEATSGLSVASEPKLAGVFYDGYVVHLEVFDCGGPGPVAHTGGEGTEAAGGESGGESAASGGDEGNGNFLAPDETFDVVRGGARLILKYDAPSNTFKGTVENTTDGVLRRVRIEVHLSNGAELGPTTPLDMAPGEVAAVNLAATAAAFTGWIAHAEVGGGVGSESGGEGGGEHGSGGGSGGEHGAGGEQSGGG